MRRSVLILLVMVLTITVFGCRQRIRSDPIATDDLFQVPQQELETALSPDPDQNQEQDHSEDKQKTGTEDTQEAPQKSSAPAQTDAVLDNRAPDTVEIPFDQTKQSNTEYNPDSNDTANIGVHVVASDRVSVIKPNDEISGQTTLDNNEGGAIGLIIDRYTELLKQGVGTLYPCEMGNVYFEKSVDFLTVESGSPEHNMIKESGGLNVADILRSDALKVDTSWIIRKNPDTIVKCVDSNVLGYNVHDSASAARIYDDLRSRQGWDSINAVMNGNVILLSEELFNTDEGRLAAKLYIASAIYPALFSSADLDEYLTLIFGEDSGIFVYM